MNGKRWPSAVIILLPVVANAVGFGEIPLLPCDAHSSDAHVSITFPKDGQKLNAVTDLAFGMNLLLRFSTINFTLPRDGRVYIHIKATNTFDSTDVRINHDFVLEGSTCKNNLELFGLTRGTYQMIALLVDHDGRTRKCWGISQASFSIYKQTPLNRSDALLHSLQSLHQSGGRMRRAERPWMRLPQTHHDFGYVTALWGNAYMDNVIAWTEGLRAVGSTFPTFCMVVAELIAVDLIPILEDCCCRVLQVEAIESPWPETPAIYKYVLTKLRLFQLQKHGLKKIVFMDADTLILQNIDELFWVRAPAAVPLPDSFLGSEVLAISAGMLVLETSEDEFERIMQKVEHVDANASGFKFIEQDLLALHWLQNDSRELTLLPLTYNVCPEEIAIMPFLSSNRVDAGRTARFPIDHGVKVFNTGLDMLLCK